MRANEATARKVVAALSDELRRPPWRSHWHPLAGHCYVASEAFWHLTGRKLRPQVMRWEGGTHWFLREPNSRIWDLTAGQFEEYPDHRLGRGCGFLTSGPSRRAQVVIDRVLA